MAEKFFTVYMQMKICTFDLSHSDKKHIKNKAASRTWTGIYPLVGKEVLPIKLPQLPLEKTSFFTHT